jgi:hypothetical protein
VQPIADEDEVGERLLAVGVGAVAMVPVQELLEREEHREPQKDERVDLDLRQARREPRRDHVKERAAQQRAGGEGHERQQQALQRLLAQHQRDAADQRDRAHQEAASHDPQQRRLHAQ